VTSYEPASANVKVSDSPAGSWRSKSASGAATPPDPQGSTSAVEPYSTVMFMFIVGCSVHVTW